MQTLLLLAALLGSLSAEARPNTQTMTTAQARALVSQNGAVVLSTSSFGYDRFVASPSYCAGGEAAVAAYVPTLDSDAAFIGYSCTSGSRGQNGPAKIYARVATACREGQTQRASRTGPGRFDAEYDTLRVCNNGRWERAMGADPVGPK